MLRSEAWEILGELWDNANEAQREALHIAQHDIEFVDLMPDDVVAVGSCDGCFYSNRKRPQKCSCCRRNKDLKDCYEEEGK